MDTSSINLRMANTWTIICFSKYNYASKVGASDFVSVLSVLLLVNKTINDNFVLLLYFSKEIVNLCCKKGDIT